MYGHPQRMSLITQFRALCPRGFSPWILPLTLALLFITTGAATGQSPSPQAEPENATSKPKPPETFLDEVNVSASGSERTVEETPGKVDVIDSEEIAQLGYTHVADLVKYTPGVYVDGDVTRLGTSGFNIRGIGGNRVLTRIDGVPASEQFDFGPFSVTQYSLDLDALERAEIVRSAGSALYGSNAIGGVVSLVTRSPSSYLQGQPQYFSLRGGWDGRAAERSETLVYARGSERWQGSLLFSRRDGEELDNQGSNDAQDSSRTRPNPIDRSQNNLLTKVSRSGTSSQLEGTLEWFDSRSETEIFSSRTAPSPFASAVIDADAIDSQDRLRLSLTHSLVPDITVLDSLLWRGYWQDTETEQETFQVRLPSGSTSNRAGRLSFDQTTFGLDLEARKGLGAEGRNLLTYGVALRQDRFDQLRDRTETFAASGEPVPTSLVFPTKYFPASEVDELGAFAQAELSLWQGRLLVVPGARYDRYSLDSDQNDETFITGNPGTAVPADLTDEAVSPKLGIILGLGADFSLFAQYARGFRAPPMSSVNNGFTNRAGGYRTLANPDLEPETSDNLEFGVRGSLPRGSFSVTAFENRYADFIETVFLGFNPQEGLVEFQPQNITSVQIEGIEFAGEFRFGQRWLGRAAYSRTEGENTTLDEPLESVAPHTLVTGLRYQRERWGTEGTVTYVDAKNADDLPSDSTQFQTPSYATFDLAAWLPLTQRISLQANAWNLSDETYWTWTNARGQAADSTTLDRYTSPGRSFGLQLRVEF